MKLLQLLPLITALSESDVLHAQKAPTASLLHDTPACIAKKVKIQSTTSMPLQMFEVQVIESGTNVALQGTVRQSSVYENDEEKFGPANAIDNDVTSFSHTESEFGSWWEVYFQEPAGVQGIRILNRYCGSDTSDPKECLCRLTGAEIHLYNDINVTVAKRVLGDTCHQHILLEDFISCSSSNVLPSKTPSTASAEAEHILTSTMISKGLTTTQSVTKSTDQKLPCKEPYAGYCIKGIYDGDACKFGVGFLPRLEINNPGSIFFLLPSR